MIRHLLLASAISMLLASASCQDPTIAAAATGPAAADVVGADADAWEPHRATKVLYAGFPGGSREAAFRAFLERHFDAVALLDLRELSASKAAAFDVVVADWGSYYGKDGYPDSDETRECRVQINRDFGVPVVAMNHLSSSLRPRHKLDWL